MPVATTSGTLALVGRGALAGFVLAFAFGALAAPEDVAQNNIFDPKRQPWPEKEPPAAPVPVLSKDDVVVYGIVSYGPQRKAIVRLSGKLKDALPSAKGRQYVTLTEGQALGGYTLESVQVDKLVFASSGGKATIGIEKKNDRPGPPPSLPTPVQGSYIAVVEMPIVTNPWTGGGAPAGASAPAGAPPTPFPVPPMPSAGQVPGGGGQDGATPPPPANAPNPTETAAAPTPVGDGPKTLLEAIQAAKAAQQAARGAQGK